MSQVKISGNASGTGVFTVASPNSNNTQTLTLPDTTGTLMAQTATGTNLTSGTKYQVGGVTTNALAWVNFNGTTSPGTIRAQYNVSSVTKNGTGDFTVNMTTALADINYSVAATTSSTATATASYFIRPFVSNAGGVAFTSIAPTTTAFRFCTGGILGADMDYAMISVFGN